MKIALNDVMSLPSERPTNTNTDCHATARKTLSTIAQNCETRTLPVAQAAPHSPQRKRFNLRMKSFSLDSPESPSVMGVGGYPSSQTTGHNSGQDLADMMPVRQDYEQHAAGALYSGQQHYAGQSGYQQQQQPAYLQPDDAGGYQQQHQYGESSVAADTSQLNSYLSATRQTGAHQHYQHRHSFHNPSFHYPAQQQQHDDRLEVSNQHSSSHSALNSIHPNPLDQVRRVGGPADVNKRASTDNVTTAPNDCKLNPSTMFHQHPFHPEQGMYVCDYDCPPFISVTC